MRAIVALAQRDQLDDDDIADLARCLAQSGHRLAVHHESADISSTGGPSSLSTLICPLQLWSRGLTVPKIGVRGRPAGGVDILETIPGFTSALTPEAAESALKRSRYVHVLANERWVPLDARLFALRQREGAQAIPVLAIASLLAKKLAAGVTGAGLDARVAAHGNFGATFEEARRFARRYKSVAAQLGMNPVCALTDAMRPYQPYIGRGEALLALAAILDGRAGHWLNQHTLLCLKMSDAVATSMGADVSEPPSRQSLREGHTALLTAHDTDILSFDRRADRIRSSPRVTVHAERDGVLSYDLPRLRTLLVDCQQRHATPHAPSDPAGVILGPEPGTVVAKGQVTMSVRVPPGETQLSTALSSCAIISDIDPSPAYSRHNLELV